MRVEDMWSLEGLLTCDIDESSDHIAWQSEYFTNDESSKQKLTECLLASESHQSRSVGYLRVSLRLLAYLNNLVPTIEPRPPAEGVYQRLSDLIEDWAKILEEIQGAVHRYIVELMTAQMKDYASVGHLMDLRHRYLVEYRKKKTCTEIRGLYGFLNHQSKEEVARLVGSHFSLLNKATTAVLHQVLHLFQSFTEKWDSVLISELENT